MATLLGGVNAVPSSPVNLQVRLADLAGDKFKVSGDQYPAEREASARVTHSLLCLPSLPRICSMPYSTRIAASERHKHNPLRCSLDTVGLNICHSHVPRARCPSVPQDLPRFFSPTAVVVWEGNSVTGSQQLTHLFSVLPPTKHTLTSIDSHPITPPNTTPTASSSAAPQSLLVSVSGTVVYGLDSGGVRGFFHSFVLEKGSGGVGYSYIVSASFRTRQLIEPEKPKKQYRSSV